MTFQAPGSSGHHPRDVHTSLGAQGVSPHPRGGHKLGFAGLEVLEVGELGLDLAPACRAQGARRLQPLWMGNAWKRAGLQ